jgi:tetratricopeptide (TPR) repeat protein
VAEAVIRSFGSWTRTILEMPNLPKDGLETIFDSAEDLIANTDHSEMLPELLHAKSVYLVEVGRFTDALIPAERGLALKRSHRDGPGCKIAHHLYYYYRILNSLGRYSEALENITEAITEDPDDADAWEARALLLLFRFIDYRGAERDASAALSFRETAVRFRILSFSLGLRGEWGKAISSLHSAHRLDPTDAYSALWLAGISGDISVLKRLKEDDPWIFNVVRYYRGEMLEEDLLKLAAATTNVLEQSQRLCEAHCYIALHYEREMNDQVTAGQHYKKSYETNIDTYWEWVWSRDKCVDLKAADT